VYQSNAAFHLLAACASAGAEAFAAYLERCSLVMMLTNILLLKLSSGTVIGPELILLEQNRNMQNLMLRCRLYNYT